MPFAPSTSLVTGIKPSSRTLSKSDFNLARSCEAKLFFRENRYPDNSDINPYLVLLREGGYMVEALAKAKHTDGVQLEYGGGVADDWARTLQHLQRDAVTLFEATLVAGRRQARVDILEKRGNAVRLLEVKSKSFDCADHTQLVAGGKAGGALRSSKKPYGILSDWVGKLEDITFQVLLLEQVLPGVTITPVLVLVDKSKQARLDNIPGLFELVSRTSGDGTRRLHTARYIGTAEQLADLDLVSEIDVSAEVAMLRDEVEEATERFESRLDAPLAAYTTDLMRGAKCSSCEFRVPEGIEQSGFNECWGPLSKPKPHMLELFSIGKVKAIDGSPLIDWMIGQGKTSLLDIPEECLVKKDGTIGVEAARQRRQLDCTRREHVFVDPELSAVIEALHGPMHFVDFETSRLALPYHRGMNPYGLVAFQWSAHTVQSHGQRATHREWLNNSEVWPNKDFTQTLRDAIGDSGSVLTWSPFEKATLRQIIPELKKFRHDVPELIDWMNDVCDNRIVDMHKWAVGLYYHPGMRGRTSIKVVLDALWKSDDAMRRQFTDWTGLPADSTKDPYSSLRPVEIAGILQDVHEGTGAMRAYQEMMYGSQKHDSAVTTGWATLLKQYCALDTLSMVLILEHWRRVATAT